MFELDCFYPKGPSINVVTLYNKTYISIIEYKSTLALIPCIFVIYTVLNIYSHISKIVKAYFDPKFIHFSK